MIHLVHFHSWVVTAKGARINIFCFEMLMKFTVALTVAVIAKKVVLAVGESRCVCSSALQIQCNL